MTSVLAKNAGKVIVHVTKRNYLVTTLHEVFNRLQAFLFSFCGESKWKSKENKFFFLGSHLIV